ncbi:MAG TPA: LysR family transcriptional regulator [Rhizomicrobium sp.]|nr:LysR family transcriptional regulator [Rhizomicrobium sp.]
MDPLFDQSQKDFHKSPLDDHRILSGPFWAELRVFLAVAKAKSYNRAGEELGMSRQTISRDILRLQDLMGAVLLVSSNSGVQLTDRGRELANRLLALDQMLFAMSHELRAETREAEGQVRIVATEALTGFFIVPGLAGFAQQYPKIHARIRNPVNLLSFRENQCDVMVGFGPLNDADLESRPVGFLHLLGTAARSYIDEHGVPTWETLPRHRFVDTDYYASQTPTFAPWRSAVARGITAHHCDNPFAYGLMIKAGAGIGLLGNFVMADPDFIPVGMGIHVKLPIYIHAQSERLKARPVRIVFDWLADIFSAERDVFAEELNFETISRKALSPSIHHLSMGMPVPPEQGQT